MPDKIFDIGERTKEFAVRIVRFCSKMDNSIASREIAKQLIRSGTSVGANLQEASGSISKKEFISKVGISRKEAKETTYWLDIIQRSKLLKNQQNVQELSSLLIESEEISKILSSIIIKARSKP
ncbi:MAG: four helix bundle protein [Candidatus Margulisiibacteriota bacterium]